MTGESTRPDDPIEVGRRAVALGLLSDDQARAALERYRQGRAGQSSFAAFLLDSGMVRKEHAASLSQLGGHQAAPSQDLDRTHADGLSPDSDPADPLVGRSFSGCRVVKKLGQGGMGSVYLAVRGADQRQVVVKFLAPEQAMNKT